MKDNEIYLIYDLMVVNTMAADNPTLYTHRSVISHGLPTTICLIETEEIDQCLQEIVSIEGL